MSQTFLTIQEASEIAKKSIQTIRRAIKAKKIIARKKKTPQGYNYMVEKDSLAQAYNLKAIFDEQMKEKKKTGDEKISKSAKNLSNQYLTRDDLGLFQDTVQSLINQHEKDKENFFRLVKSFQDRMVVLENQVKLIEKPKKKWYEVWK